MGSQRWSRVAAGVLAVAVVAGCAGAPRGADPVASQSPDQPSSTPAPDPSAAAAAVAPRGSAEGADVTVADPGALRQPMLTPDLLVYRARGFDPATVRRISRLPGVTHVEVMSMGSFYAERRQVTYAAVDPATFRRFTPPGTGQTTEVWQRVAAGEIAISPALGEQMQDAEGYVTIGNEGDPARIHVGAYAQILDPGFRQQIDAVVNAKWTDQLGLPRGNALIVSTGDRAPADVVKPLRRLTDAGEAKAQVVIQGPDLDLSAPQTAVLTGGSVAEDVGSFTYTANPNGSVNPDPRWVAANIRTEDVPILGSVTCHRVMLPQLRAALTEISERGLADRIDPGQFGGCYVPRFIASDPSQGLSFHTFGTAVDLNVPGNLRGTVGEIDRTVVSIFKRWGFAWGGDWNYTDPMHFELARIVRPG
ncbi:hypothetical protein GCM10027425_25250 [Alteromonas gracilis]